VRPTWVGAWESQTEHTGIPGAENVDRLRWIIVIGVVAIVAIVLGAQTRDEGGSTEGGVALAGTTLTGEAFDLQGTRGRPTVVNFFASWCPPCNAEAPDLVAFAQAHPDVSFVGVAVSDERADAEAFVAKYGLPYPVVYDPQGATGDVWRVTGIPTTFFLDARGEVRDTIVGAASREQFEASLAKVQ